MFILISVQSAGIILTYIPQGIMHRLLVLIVFIVSNPSFANTEISLLKTERLKDYAQINSVWLGPLKRFGGLVQIEVESAVNKKNFLGHQYRLLSVEHDPAARLLFIEKLGVGLNGCCKSVLNTRYFRIQQDELGHDFKVYEWLNHNTFTFGSTGKCYIAKIEELHKMAITETLCSPSSP